MSLRIEYERGVAVDAEGYFVAALKWEAGTPAPKLNERATSGGKAPRLILLRDPYAVDNVMPSARWDFTPVREDGVLVRAGTWELPTEIRYTARVRRDKPGIATFTGKRAVWPERLPTLPDGLIWVGVEPPKVPGGKPLWDIETEQWFTPKTVMVLDAENKLKATPLVVDNDDLTLAPGDQVIEPTVPVTAENEIGRTTGPEVGDVIDPQTLAFTPRPVRLRRVPVRLLRRVLQQRGLLSAFAAYAQAQGFTLDDLEGRRSISITSPFFRGFVQEQGFTMAQAFRQIHKAVETERGLEREIDREFEG